MRSVLSLIFLVICEVVFAPNSFAEKLEILARPGPWPVADNLVLYRDKIWFSSAVKGINHNSADIWSYSPKTKITRFERYLFSQDSGRPVVHSDLLYWPHEDMRVGLGVGVVSVTNGKDWKNLYLPSSEYMMHTHSMTEWKGQLVAAMAGWHSSIVTSKNAGASWQMLVSDAPRTGSFHRYNDVVALGDQLFAKHWERDGLKLARFHKGEMVSVKNWPRSSGMSRFVPFKDALYVIVDVISGPAELWRIDANGHQHVPIEPADLDLRAIASDGSKLWLATKSGDGGQLLSSADGNAFVSDKTFTGGVAHDAISIGENKIYVVGRGANGKAILWGPEAASISQTNAEYSNLPGSSSSTSSSGDFVTLKLQLVSALKDRTYFARHGSGLRELIVGILAENPPEGFFTSMLDREILDEEIEVFGGQFTVSSREVAIWQLINAMEQNNEATVPVKYLTTPWKRKPNGPQKWFDPLLVSMRAVQLAGQNDRSTINALVERLDMSAPDWLQSQVTGTLTALTGQQFAHNHLAWKNWWLSVRSAWPKLTTSEKSH